MIAKKLSLKRQQVYKWLWDRKKMDKTKKSEGKLEAMKALEENEEDELQLSDTRIFCYAKGSGRIRVPFHAKHACKFTINPGVSAWAIDVIKNYGWQLIDDTTSTQKFILNERSQMIENLIKREPVEMMEIELNPPPRTGNFEIIEEEEESYQFLKKRPGCIEMKEDEIESSKSFERYMFSR